MAVDPLSVFRKVLTSGTTPRDIDMMYDIPPPDVSVPDARTADVDPNSIMAGSGTDMSSQPPAAPVSVLDAPAVSRAPSIVAPPQPVNMSTPNQSLPPEPNASPIPPVTLPADSTPKESKGGVEVAGGPTRDEAIRNAYAGAALAEATRGSPVQKVPEQDKLVSTQVQEGIEVPNAIKLRTWKADQAEQEAAKKETEAAVGKEQAAKIAADMEAAGLKKEKGEKAADYQRHVDEAKQMDADYEKLAADTAVKPGSFWASKDTGSAILSAISFAILGLAGKGGGEAIDKMIERDYQQRNLNRDKKLSAAHQSIENFKSRMLSPEAADMMQRSLADKAAAAEARSLAAAASVPEIRAKGEKIAADLELSAAAKAREGAIQEAGKRVDTLRHVEAHTTGGGPTLQQTYDKLKKQGFNDAEIKEIIVTGGLHGKQILSEAERAQASDVFDRSIVDPKTGETLYAPKGEATGVRKELDAGNAVLNMLANLKRLSKVPGGMASPEARSMVTSTLAMNKDALDALGIKDLSSIDPHSVNYKDVGAGITQAEEILRSRMEARKRGLSTQPYVMTPPKGKKASDIEE